MVSLAELMSSSVIAIGMGRKLAEDVYFTVFHFFHQTLKLYAEFREDENEVRTPRNTSRILINILAAKIAGRVIEINLH